MGYERFVDRVDSKELIKNCPDFVLRRHGLPPSWMIYAFVVVLLLILILINYLAVSLILLPHDAPTPLNNILVFLITISVLLTGVAVFAYSMVHKIREIVLQTEFQNLLFASSAAVDSHFCAIATKDNLIVYYDYNFDQLFPKTDNTTSTYERIAKSAGFSDEEQGKFHEIIRECKTGTVMLNHDNLDGTSVRLKIQIDPLRRPSGHMVIRGYDIG